MSTATAFFKLLRIRQWPKNAVCLAGAFFGGRFQGEFLARALMATACFCAASGFVYVINDILDRERDRNHPWKKFRPIASGVVTVPKALAVGILMLAAAAGIGVMLGSAILTICGFYVLLNVLYSAALKNLSLVDAMVVATGFILRVYAGTVAVHVAPSAWLLLCTLFLALFLAFAKRRAELDTATEQIISTRAVLQKCEVKGGAVSESEAVVQDPEAPKMDINATRAVLHKYTLGMLDRFCNICAALTIATYALFTVLGHADRSFIITNPPVVMGIFRYLLLVERHREGEAPEAILFKDWAIQLAILIWAILYIAVLYGGLHIDVQ
jgi:4-hydroxybenzoate polyprenyltransferase